MGVNFFIALLEVFITLYELIKWLRMNTQKKSCLWWFFFVYKAIIFCGKVYRFILEL